MSAKSPSRDFPGRAPTWLLLFLFASAVYLYTFPQPNVFYAVVVLLHALVGVVVSVLLAALFFRALRQGSIASRLGWVLIALGAMIGLVLIKTGTPRVEWNLLYVHMLVSLAGGGILLAEWAGNRGWLALRAGSSILRLALSLLMMAVL